MKKLILLAGIPGAGKTYLCNMILKELPMFNLYSLDDVKERLFDEIGFNSIEEKNELIQQSLNEYYNDIEKNMAKYLDIILDYPFSDKQKSILSAYAKKYNYDVVTIRLVGDLNILYQRRIKRDLRNDRHLAHMVSSYHKGDHIENHADADLFITYEEFLDICTKRKYAEFQLGYLINVDVTDFKKVDYPQVIKELKEVIQS